MRWRRSRGAKKRSNNCLLAKRRRITSRCYPFSWKWYARGLLKWKLKKLEMEMPSLGSLSEMISPSFFSNCSACTSSTLHIQTDPRCRRSVILCDCSSKEGVMFVWSNLKRECSKEDFYCFSWCWYRPRKGWKWSKNKLANGRLKMKIMVLLTSTLFVVNGSAVFSHLLFSPPHPPSLGSVYLNA